MATLSTAMPASTSETPPDDASSFFHPCLAFLKDNSTTTTTKRSWSIQSTALRGLVVVATEAIPPNTILFDLPQSRVLSYQRDVCGTPLSKYLLGLFANDNNADNSISPEELTWLNMIVWLNQTDTADTTDSNYCHTYLKALDSVPPVLSSWPQPLQDLLVGTNIQTQNKDGTTTKSAAVAVDLLLAFLGRARLRIAEKEKRCQEKDGTTANKGIPDDDSVHSQLKARNILMQHATVSIFNKAAILWARGHFMSRRFPDSLLVSSTASTDTHTATTPPPQPSFCFIPVLDLMNHSALPANSCKIATHTTTTQNQHHYLRVTSGERPMAKGDEFFYSYGASLSNEVLLQAYGFCLADNPADTVSVRIVPNHNSAATTSSSYVGVIGRGGISAIPADLWKALATTTKQSTTNANSSDASEEEEVEIGSGDLELLLEYFAGLLKALMLTMTDTTGTATNSAGEKRKRTPDDEHKNTSVETKTTAAVDSTSADAVETERRRYIHLYKEGQREILEELVRDLTLCLAPESTA